MSTNPPDQSGSAPDPNRQPPQQQPPHAPQPPQPQPPYSQQQPPQPPLQPQPQYAQPGPPSPAYAQQPAKAIGGGWIWLGIVIAVVVPFLALWLGIAIDSAASARGEYGTYASFTVTLVGVVGLFIAAVVLTCIGATRRTGIGMWIGIVALPIIGFGVCTTLLFTS